MSHDGPNLSPKDDGLLDATLDKPESLTLTKREDRTGSWAFKPILTPGAMADDIRFLILT